MADYNKYDERVDGLVIETKTHWDPSVGNLTPEDRALLSQAIHRAPKLAAKIHYERAHTGYTREITVTVEDIQRLYQLKVAN